MSLDIAFRCRVTMRELGAFGSYIRDGRRVCDCHGEPVWVDIAERPAPHAFIVAPDGTVEEHIGGAS